LDSKFDINVKFQIGKAWDRQAEEVAEKAIRLSFRGSLFAEESLFSWIYVKKYFSSSEEGQNDTEEAFWGNLLRPPVN
jgi:hypothetical protein